MVMFGITGYCGLKAVLLLIHHFGAVAAVTGTVFKITLHTVTLLLYFSDNIPQNAYCLPVILAVHKTIYFTVSIL